MCFVSHMLAFSLTRVCCCFSTSSGIGINVKGGILVFSTSSFRNLARAHRRFMHEGRAPTITTPSSLAAHLKVELSMARSQLKSKLFVSLKQKQNVLQSSDAQQTLLAPNALQLLSPCTSFAINQRKKCIYGKYVQLLINYAAATVRLRAAF